jgi:hypothetical protein
MHKQENFITRTGHIEKREHFTFMDGRLLSLSIRYMRFTCTVVMVFTDKYDIRKC